MRVLHIHRALLRCISGFGLLASMASAQSQSNLAKQIESSACPRSPTAIMQFDTRLHETGRLSSSARYSSVAGTCSPGLHSSHQLTLRYHGSCADSRACVGVNGPP